MSRIGAVDVVLLYYRLGPDVFDTVDAILTQSYTPLRLTVVDNDSQDGVVEDLVRARPSVRTVRSLTNVGYGAGINLGLRSLGDSAGAVLFMTHDCLLDTDTVAGLVAELDSDPAVAVAGPLLGYRRDPSTVFSAGGYLEESGWTRHLGQGEPMDLWSGAAAVEAEWLDGACQLVRRRALDDVGPFDEDYFLYWEEVAFDTRVRSRGWKVHCVRDAAAWQDPGDYTLYYMTRNRLRFMVRHAPRRAFLAHLAHVIRDVLVERRDRQTRLRAVRDFIRGYGGPDRGS